jgi:hypothetical protein
MGRIWQNGCIPASFSTQTRSSIRVADLLFMFELSGADSGPLKTERSKTARIDARDVLHCSLPYHHRLALPTTKRTKCVVTSVSQPKQGIVQTPALSAKATWSLAVLHPAGMVPNTTSTSTLGFFIVR